MANGVRIEGVGELRTALKRAGTLALPALSAAMIEEQEKVMASAKERTPVDFGVLRASGTVLPPKISGTGVEVVAGFGGAASDYAVIVHEDLSANHPTGQSKFLESAFLERAHEMPRALAAGVYAALKRLG